jgi:hypothetical protein
LLQQAPQALANIMVEAPSGPLLVALIPAALALPVTGDAESHPPIKHNAGDGIVRLYGAGWPGTAFRKVVAVFTNETRIKMEITGGPEPTWSKIGSTDAVIIRGIAEEHMTAPLEIYKSFVWHDVTPMCIRPGIIVVNKSTVSDCGQPVPVRARTRHCGARTPICPCQGWCSLNAVKRLPLRGTRVRDGIPEGLEHWLVGEP